MNFPLKILAKQLLFLFNSCCGVLFLCVLLWGAPLLSTTATATAAMEADVFKANDFPRYNMTSQCDAQLPLDTLYEQHMAKATRVAVEDLSILQQALGSAVLTTMTVDQERKWIMSIKDNGEAICYGAVLGMAKRIENNMCYCMAADISKLIAAAGNAEFASWPTKVAEFLDAKYIGSTSSDLLSGMDDKFSQLKAEIAFQFIGLPLGKGVAEMLWSQDLGKARMVIIVELFANGIPRLLDENVFSHFAHHQDTWYGAILAAKRLQFFLASKMATIGLCLYYFRIVSMEEVGILTAGVILV
jgi:hypothetical protein